MCPACIAAAALLIGKVSSAGSVTAFLVRKFAARSGRSIPSNRAAAPVGPRGTFGG
jgi:hypothetical protein